MSITLRTVKDTALTHEEMDENLCQFVYSASIEDNNQTLKLFYTGSGDLSYSPRSSSISLNPFPYTGSLAVTGSQTIVGNTVQTGSLDITGSFNLEGNTIQTGSLEITGSITVTGGGITGSSTTAVSASYSYRTSSSSYSETSTSASYAETGTTADTAISASYTDTTTSASYAETGTTADTATSASYSETSTSASYAETNTSASYSEISTSASYAETGTTADTAISASYTNTADSLGGIESSQFLRSDENDTMTGDLDITGGKLVENLEIYTSTGEKTPQRGTKYIRLVHSSDTATEIDLENLSTVGEGEYVFLYINVGSGTGYDVDITDGGATINSLNWSTGSPGSIDGVVLLWYDGAGWRTLVDTIT